MRHINIYNTTEEYNAAKIELYDLEHFVAYNKEINEILTKDIVNITFNITPEDATINYSIDNESYDQVASNGVPIQVTYKSTLYYKISKSGYSDITGNMNIINDITISYQLSKDIQVGDIAIEKDGSIDVVKIEQITQDDIVIGVVVVPPSHNRYGDGSFAIMSMCNMSYRTPEEGAVATGSERMPIGFKHPTDVTIYDGSVAINRQGQWELNENVINIEASGSALPTDRTDVNEISSPFDPFRGYYYTNNVNAPSPYKYDQSANDQYSLPMYEMKKNVLSDFNGIDNTSKMAEQTTEYDWKSSTTIEITKGYPAACCCSRYHTKLTNSGDWYLPAAGEAGYIAANLITLNNSINKVIDIIQPGSFMFKPISVNGSDLIGTSSISNYIDEAYPDNINYFIYDIYSGHLYAGSVDATVDVRAFLKLKL